MARPSGVAYAPHRRGDRRRSLRRLAFRAQERAVVLGYRAAAAALGLIPTGISVPVARLAFRAAYALWPAKRRIVLANAGHVLGLPTDDPQVARLAHRMYATYARYIVELMRLPSRPADEPARLVVAEGERGAASFAALVERLQADGRGMIVASVHIGSIETLVAAFASRGWPIHGLADDSAYPELFELLNAQRRRWGVEIIAWRNLREIYRVLRKGGILALLVDWGYRPDGIPVRLFGDWTTLPAGPAVLAAKTGAPIVPVVNRRRDDGRFEAVHFEPIDVSDDSPAALAAATQALADTLEAMIRPAPEQWYTFKPVWPATAEEAAGLAARAAGQR
ncbi:MAG TPA: lysophospholipid acyltransferase family protein [Candidatus Limnocylindrales bacterium]|nr:lysophospholipid acyltransferase family protein [Candidatus Limnocylindrales bacterium]